MARVNHSHSSTTATWGCRRTRTNNSTTVSSRQRSSATRSDSRSGPGAWHIATPRCISRLLAAKVTKIRKRVAVCSRNVRPRHVASTSIARRSISRRKLHTRLWQAPDSGSATRTTAFSSQPYAASLNRGAPYATIQQLFSKGWTASRV